MAAISVHDDEYKQGVRVACLIAAAVSMVGDAPRPAEVIGWAKQFEEYVRTGQ